MKKGRKTIHHLRPKITMAVPGERVNATGLEGTPENVNIDSTGPPGGGGTAVYGLYRYVPL